MTVFGKSMGSALSVALIGAGAIAHGQGADEVTLQSFDDSISVTGQLLGFNDGAFSVRTSMGDLRLSADVVRCLGAACPAAEPTFVAGSQVTLKDADGSMTLTGTLQDFKDNEYFLKTSMGDLRLSADQMTCDGAGCPTLASASASAAVAAPAAAPAIPNVVDVRFAGSDTVGLGLMPYLLEDYADYLNAGADKLEVSETQAVMRYSGNGGSGPLLQTLLVTSTGSGDAFDALQTRAAHFGMASRQAREEEAAALLAAGAGTITDPDHETVIAVDSLAVIVHPDNPVRGLTLDQIGQIYLGQVTNWADLGGRNAPITVLSREDGSSTRGVFEKAVFAGDEPPLGSRVTYPGGDNPEMAEAVRTDPNAIAYVGFAYSEGLKRLDLTSSCGITSTATPFAVKTEAYPLGRRLYLYHRPDAMTSAAQEFLRYVQSPDADDAIAQSSFVNFAVERRVQDADAAAGRIYRDLAAPEEFDLARALLNDMRGWDQLSTTVRFQTGSSLLGNKEINDISRLISYLETLPAGTEVAVVGFTDDIGSFGRNRDLAEQRAATVLRSITQQAGGRLRNVRLQTRAYSELSPAVCNTDANGRSINRRTEVWVRRSS